MGRALVRPALFVGVLAGSVVAGTVSLDGDLASRIVGAALVDSRAYDKLTHLCDRIGHRLSGSAALDRAVEWAEADLRRDGLEHVWTEPVMVPRWVRGDARARVVAPAEHELALLALGGSVGTGDEGLEAEVIAVEGLEELDTLGDAVAGKIVLFNRQIEAGFSSERGYGWGVGARSKGASRAAAHGAVGMLIRSLGTVDYRLPHTGAMSYEDGVPRVPAAAIAAEDASLIQRLQDAGETVRVRMELGCRTLPDVESHNVIAEIRGSELPDEIVLIGAHLDSWDVGHGAHDDGAGCVIVMETMRQLQRLGPKPRRTVRAVLFTNEENGLRGGKDYARRHPAARHVVAIETDSGGFRPLGFGVSAGEGGVEMVQAIADRLVNIEANRVLPKGGGADISPLKKLGVPVMALVHDTLRYFDYHHTEADTLDKVDRRELDLNVAALTWMAFRLADQEEVLPRLTVEAEDGE